MTRTTKNAAAAAAPVAATGALDLDAIVKAAVAAALANAGVTAEGKPVAKKAATPADGGAVWPGDGNAWNVVLPKGAKVIFKTFADAKDKTGVEHVITLTEDKPVTITGYVSGVHWGKVAPKVMRKAKA